ncbi:MAG: hypothetical protein JO119_21395 [Acidobacteria bacterium]|nr:hypothetical protein [Acidobacteriota bacterium]
MDTLEKLARALDVPMYQLFHKGRLPENVRKIKVDDSENFGEAGQDREYFLALHKALFSSDNVPFFILNASMTC